MVALKRMDPDTDGLSAEFYKVFWIDISFFFKVALTIPLTPVASPQRKEEESLELLQERKVFP